MKLLFCFSLLFSTVTYAEEYVLIGSISQVKYDVVKLRSTHVEGLNSEDSSKELKGLISFSNAQTLEDLQGFVEWKNPFFQTDSAGRDDHVKTMFESSIIAHVSAPKEYDSKSGDATFDLTILINEKSVVVPARGNLVFAKDRSGRDIAIFKGSAEVNRKSWGLKIRGAAAVGDRLIRDAVNLDFNLIFGRLK